MRSSSSRAFAHRMPTWLQASVTLTSVLAVASCSAPPGALPLDDDGVDVPEFQGMLGSPGASTPQQPGAVAPAPNTGATGSTNTNGNPPPAAPSNNEQNGANGAPLTPGNTGSNTGANNNGANSGANNNGANNGAAGSSMVPPPSGNQGAGGSSMGGGENPSEPPPSDQEPPPVTQPPVTQPPVTQPPAPSGPDIPCPADAFFCSGFENGFPDGTNNVLGGTPFANAFVLDTAEKHSGAQSFLVPPTTERFSYRVLAIPVTTQQFWARTFFRTDVAFGSSNDHESIIAVSTATETQDNNAEGSPGKRVELSEQFRYMLLNISDTTPEPLVRTQLSANEWHCIEARYDGAAGQVEIFADGEQFIDQEGALVQLNIQTFRLGYMQFNGGPRSVWYDDVILSPNRVGCN